MEYTNALVEAHSRHELAGELDGAMAARAAEGWRVVAVANLGNSGSGGVGAIVTFERPIA